MSGSALASQIKEHMPVVGSDGGHVGTVDAMEEDRIKLTKQDDPGGRALHHHYLPVSAVAAVMRAKCASTWTRTVPGNWQP